MMSNFSRMTRVLRWTPPERAAREGGFHGGSGEGTAPAVPPPTQWGKESGRAETLPMLCQL